MESELLMRLGHASLTGTVAVLLVLFVSRTIPRLPGAVRSWLWWLVCLKFLLDLFALSVVPFTILPRATLPLPVGRYQGEAETYFASPPVAAGMRPGDLPDEHQLTLPPEGEVSSALPTPDSDWHRYLPFFLLGAWLVGIGIEVGGQWRALAQLQRLLTGARRQQLPLLEEAALRAGLRRVPDLWVLPVPVEPLTVGLRRPGIALSHDDLNRLSDVELLPILTHECVHLRRYDLWLALVPWLARAFFWFLPPVYLAAREFELAREIACDQQTVVALSVAPHSYGALLVKLSSSSSALSPPSSAMALSAGFRNLKRRIEMLEIKPYRRRLLLPVLLVGAAILLPWRLTKGAPPSTAQPINISVAVYSDGVPVSLPNLDFAQGLKNWRKMANGSDTQAHPFYKVGVDPQLMQNKQHVGFVQARDNIADDPEGDGGVLRYDTDAIKLRGKRLRLSGLVHGVGIKRKAFLFVAPESKSGLSFATSPSVTKANEGWEQRTCVIDVPTDADTLTVGLRLEGGGTAYVSNLTLDVVDNKVPLSSVEKTAYPAASIPPPANLTFIDGLDSWWNDNPTHTADANYTMVVEPTGGQKYDPAAYLKNKVAKPQSYGTIAQNASAVPYRGKHIRLSASLKAQDATLGGLWYVLHDKDPEKTMGDNYRSGGKGVRSNQDWTRYAYDIEVSSTAETLSFGISSEGPGTVWVDDFKIDVLPPAKPK